MLTTIATTAVMTFSLVPNAAAAEPFSIDSLIHSFQSSSSSLHVPTVEELRAQNEDNAWNIRENLQRDADRLLPPQQARDAKNLVDQAIEVAFPGIVARHTAPAAPVEAPLPEPEPSSTPCPPAAKVCVDLDHQISWLQDGEGHRIGNVVPISSGAKGHATPDGSFRVTHKVKNEVSREFGNAPMPNAIYFAPGGIAFHAGDPDILSHGCVHLSYKESERYWEHLNPGDLVYTWGHVDYGVPNGAVHR